MDFRTYIIDSKNKAISKYSYMQRRITSKLFRLQERVFSRLHHEENNGQESSNNSINQSREMDSSIDFLIGEEESLLENNNKKTILINPIDEDEKIKNLPEGSELVKITLVQGKIVEKEYLTNESQKITIKF